MSAVNSLTHFPISSSLTKFNRSFTNSVSPSLSINHRCSSKSLKLSRDFISGKKSISRKEELMAERISKVSALGSGDGEENVRVLEQEAFVDGSSRFSSNLVSADLESILNRLSKWLVAALFGAVILYRHDAEALWAAMGSVINSALSYLLKKILNQERPLPNRRSDPGMPSSHAQSIFFSVMFVILSMVEWLGVNELTLIFTAISLAFGSYLSWLRVTQQLHTISQVAVGALLGSSFSVLWYWSWNALVCDAFGSLLWVRVLVMFGSAVCCLGFLLYVILNWFKNER